MEALAIVAVLGFAAVITATIAGTFVYMLVTIIREEL